MPRSPPPLTAAAWRQTQQVQQERQRLVSWDFLSSRESESGRCRKRRLNVSESTISRGPMACRVPDHKGGNVARLRSQNDGVGAALREEAVPKPAKPV